MVISTTPSSNRVLPLYFYFQLNYDYFRKHWFCLESLWLNSYLFTLSVCLAVCDHLSMCSELVCISVYLSNYIARASGGQLAGQIMCLNSAPEGGNQTTL